MNFKCLTGRSEECLIEIGSGRLVHRDVASPFQELQVKASSEIGANIQIVSSFRNFERQLMGWNAKASGKRPLYDDHDQEIDFNSLNKEELLYAILKWSAVPGGSRHHWGTDIDIFDANQMQAKDVQLLQSECIPSGPFGKLHEWLDEKIANNDSSGFYRPYDTDRVVVGIEKWHISYSPISVNWKGLYTLELFLKNIEDADILLKEQLLHHASFIFDKYINNIDSPPF